MRGSAGQNRSIFYSEEINGRTQAALIHHEDQQRWFSIAVRINSAIRRSIYSSSNHRLFEATGLLLSALLNNCWCPSVLSLVHTGAEVEVDKTSPISTFIYFHYLLPLPVNKEVYNIYLFIHRQR